MHCGRPGTPLALCVLLVESPLETASSIWRMVSRIVRKVWKPQATSNTNQYIYKFGVYKFTAHTTIFFTTCFCHQTISNSSAQSAMAVTSQLRQETNLLKLLATHGMIPALFVRQVQNQFVIAPVWVVNDLTLRNYDTFLSRHSGVPCEPGRTTFLLQEGQALMQEACTCHQCVDASTNHQKLSLKELNANNVTSAFVFLWQDICANPNDTKTNIKIYSMSFY